MTHLWSIFQFLEVTLKSDFQRCCTLFKWNTIIDIVTLIANAASVVLIQPRRSMFRWVQSSSFKSDGKVGENIIRQHVDDDVGSFSRQVLFFLLRSGISSQFPASLSITPEAFWLKLKQSDIPKFWCLCRDRPNPSDVAQPHVPTYIVVLVHVSFLVPPAMLLSIFPFVPSEGSWCVSSFSSSSSTQRLIFVCHR